MMTKQSIPVVNSAKWDDNGPAIEIGGTSNRKKWILVLGQDQLTQKAFYYAKEMEKYGVFTYFLSQDKSGVSRENIVKYGLSATIFPKKYWIKSIW